MTDHHTNTWAAKRKFNPEAEAPLDLQPKPKRRPKKTGKKAQFLAAMMDELLQYRQITDRLAAEVLSQSHNRPVSRPDGKPKSTI